MYIPATGMYVTLIPDSFMYNELCMVTFINCLKLSVQKASAACQTMAAFTKECLIDRTKSIDETIHRNKLPATPFPSVASNLK